MKKLWRKSRAKKNRTVNFALGKAEVRLVSFFNYKSGRMYHVIDVKTGHADCVGAELLENNFNERRMICR